MDIELLTSLITTLGFPVVCVLGLAFFVWHMITNQTEKSEELFKQTQVQSQLREDKLYNEIAECRKVNSKAIETIAIYAEKLEDIQKDVHDIKTDITIIKTKELQ